MPKIEWATVVVTILILMLVIPFAQRALNKGGA